MSSGELSSYWPLSTVLVPRTKSRSKICLLKTYYVHFILAVLSMDKWMSPTGWYTLLFASQSKFSHWLLSMESISTAKPEGLLWGVDLGPTVPACSWVTSRNKSLIATQDEHPICKAVYNVYRWHCRREEIEDFATCTFLNSFYPSLKFNWSISDEELPFMDLVVKPTTFDRLLYTSIHYKPTDTHILFMHPRTPLVTKLSSFLSDRDRVMHPPPCRAHFRARRDTRWTIRYHHSGVLTYHPSNVQVKNIITRNLHLVRDDPETAAVLQPLRKLCEYRRDSILRDSLDKSALDNKTVTNNDYLGCIAKCYYIPNLSLT